MKPVCFGSKQFKKKHTICTNCAFNQECEKENKENLEVNYDNDR